VRWLIARSDRSDNRRENFFCAKSETFFELNVSNKYLPRRVSGVTLALLSMILLLTDTLNLSRSETRRDKKTPLDAQTERLVMV
jgi:hypothetical protein